MFAGVALEGATLRQDLDDNAALYGKKLENRDIVTTGVRAPKAAAKLMSLLNKYSIKEGTRQVESIVRARLLLARRGETVVLVLFILLMGIIGIAFRHDAFQSLLLLLRSASDDQPGQADARRAADGA